MSKARQIAVRDPATWLTAWFDQNLTQRRGPSLAKHLVTEIDELPARFRLQVLKEAVALMPKLRRAKGEALSFEKGEALYALVGALYTEDLSHAEEDVCALLRSSRHDCGHGADVTPPLDIAVQWACENGVTDEWLRAVRVFVESLTGLTSIQANTLKKRAGLLLLLDASSDATARCWSERFRAGLGAVPARERQAWQRLVLHMGTAMGTRPPKGFPAEARRFLDEVGASTCHQRLQAWLPEPAEGAAWRLGTAGSYLLKNLVWLLGEMSRTHAPLADELVARITRLEFTPLDPLKKVAAVTAAYLVRRPPEAAYAALLRVLDWSKAFERREGDNDTIAALVASYARTHGLPSPVAQRA